MVCKTTSTKNRRGFTLVELLFTIAIGSLLFIAIGGLSLYASRSFYALVNYSDLDNQSRNALDRMTREVRQVNKLLSSSSTQLNFEDWDGATLSYIYSPNDQTLTRVKGSNSDVLLTGCESLSFATFQRNPIGGTYDQYATAMPATTKLISVTWKCVRTILGSAVNSENVQTAKIVIRNQ